MNDVLMAINKETYPLTEKIMEGLELTHKRLIRYKDVLMLQRIIGPVVSGHMLNDLFNWAELHTNGFTNLFIGKACLIKCSFDLLRSDWAFSSD